MGTWAEVASFAANPVGNGRYAYKFNGWEVSTGEQGLSRLIEVATIEERFADALELARTARPTCSHGVPLEDECFSWGLNDYLACWETCPPFILYGWHEDDFCIGMWAHGLPGGSLCVEMPDDGGAK